MNTHLLFSTTSHQECRFLHPRGAVIKDGMMLPEMKNTKNGMPLSLFQ